LLLFKENPLTARRETRFAGVPDGADALLVARLLDAAGAGTVLLHIAEDEGAMARLADCLAQFAPHAEVLTLPAWDCLPYDRVPPHGDVVAQRLSTLARLLQPGGEHPRAVITTVSAALQRVPPRAALARAAFDARVGERLSLDALNAFLQVNGYRRAGTVHEPGEYAVRGGIIDIYPPGDGDPLRLDLFGDELEGVRDFDPLTQISAEARDGFRLLPVSEVMLDAAAIARFRTGYRDCFGAAGSDPLYEAVSAGQRHPGMEHWLPLFYEGLETLFDYVDGPVTLSARAGDAVAARLDLIADYHQARVEADAGRSKGGEGDVYRPLPADALYLTASDYMAALAARATGTISAFDAPDANPGAAAGTDAVTLSLGGRRAADFVEARNRPDINLFDAVRERFARESGEGRRVIVAAYSAGSRERLAGLMRDHGVGTVVEAADWQAALTGPANQIATIVLPLERGFAIDRLSVYTEQDILGDRLVRRHRRARRADDFIAEVSSLSLGDHVVHADHGIGRYDGLVTLEIGGAPHDCLRLLYAADAKLFLPVENLEVLSRYGAGDSVVQLDRLGGAGWQARKARVKERITEMAGELLKVAAARHLRDAERMLPPPGAYDEFVARFPFDETDDQSRAITDTLADLGNGRPMDRLVCGDVGFGKTEIALRAAFVAAMAGRQVAVVVPTTLLARQHFRTFSERFAGLPVKVAQLSRLVTGKDATAARQGLADGQIDIIVGTHALLAKSISFRDLGLLIVDEEQHFGVAQKERLKALRTDVHVLTLTATPIPRTLQLALTGVRELSLIATPPVDRLAVRTFIQPFDPVMIREAIMREHFRGGQTFYVCPRIEDLPKIAEQLRKQIPEVRVAVAHGQMPASALEDVMSAFYDARYEVLLCTNIVESGLDIPTANTIIIHRADMFGLSQLYQLRGRVGRSKTRAYAYLTVPADRALTETAMKRLEVMQTLDTLGAGFTLASHDLDIRGAGNLLGEEQSGHIREVGAELYQQMLEEAVAAARDAGEGTAVADEWTPTITVGTPVLIPDAYVSDLNTRLGLYRRVARMVDAQEIESFAAELIDRFGPLPPEVENLLEIVTLKRLCRDAGVDKLDAGPKGAVVSFRNDQFADPAALIGFLTSEVGTVKLRPDHKLVYSRDWPDGAKRLKGARSLMNRLAKLAAGTAQAAQ
jgi:transcription-repair coupling factor (superfamily II helicase)